MAGFKHRTLEIVDLNRSTTASRGPLPLIPTARGAEGGLRGRAYVESVTRSDGAPLAALIGTNGISQAIRHGRAESMAQPATEATVCRTSS